MAAEEAITRNHVAIGLMEALALESVSCHPSL
jgi:hypothetical protein